MTVNVLSVRTDRPNISQREIENHVNDQSGYSVTCSETPERPNCTLVGNKLLWSNQLSVRERWKRVLKNQIRLFDVVVSLGEPSPPVTELCTRYMIPSVVFIRAMGITGLMHYKPTQSHLRNLWGTTNGARLQYPLVVNHTREMQRACEQADVVVSNSKYIQNNLREYYGVDSEIVYPPINLNDYKVEYNPDGKIGMVGPRKKRKGGYTFYELTQALPGEEFISCGLLRPDDLAEKQAQADNWEHVGWIDDMRDFYKECKVIVVPSERDEAFGRAAAEPMVSGIPVVASELGGLVEVVGNTGELVPPGSGVGAWKVAIQNALDYHDSEGQKKRVRRFGAEKQLDRFMEILTDVTQ